MSGVRPTVLERLAAAVVEAFTCPVCLTAQEDGSSLHCGHFVCRACASKLTACPVCRAPLPRGTAPSAAGTALMRELKSAFGTELAPALARVEEGVRVAGMELCHTTITVHACLQWTRRRRVTVDRTRRYGSGVWYAVNGTGAFGRHVASTLATPEAHWVAHGSRALMLRPCASDRSFVHPMDIRIDWRGVVWFGDVEVYNATSADVVEMALDAVGEYKKVTLVLHEAEPCIDNAPRGIRAAMARIAVTSVHLGVHSHMPALVTELDVGPRGTAVSAADGAAAWVTAQDLEATRLSLAAGGPTGSPGEVHTLDPLSMIVSVRGVAVAPLHLYNVLLRLIERHGRYRVTFASPFDYPKPLGLPDTRFAYLSLPALLRLLQLDASECHLSVVWCHERMKPHRAHGGAPQAPSFMCRLTNAIVAGIGYIQ